MVKRKAVIQEVKEDFPEEQNESPSAEKEETPMGVMEKLGFKPGDTVDLATLNKLARR